MIGQCGERAPGSLTVESVRSDETADAIGKVRVSDIYGSLNRTSEEKEEGKARVFIEDYRSGPSGAARIIHVRTDYDNGRFVRNPLGAVTVEPQPMPIPIEGLQ